MTFWKWFGVALGFVGVLIIFIPDAVKGDVKSAWGVLAVFGMALLYGLGIAWLKPLVEKVDMFVVMAMEMVGGIALLLPLFLIFEWSRFLNTTIDMPSVFSLVYLAVFSTFLSQIMFYKIVKARDSLIASSVTYVVPIVSVGLDLIFFSRWVGIHAILGAAVILYGVYLIHREKVKATPDFERI